MIDLNRFPVGSRVHSAYLHAAAAHKAIGQLRKYSGEEYIIHPMACLDILLAHGETDEDVLVAMPLHDVKEDVAIKPGFEHYGTDIYPLFGSRIDFIVDELTDEYTPEAYPKLNRAERKKMESLRLSYISNRGLKCKLADYIHNTSDIVKNDPNFAKAVYLPEKRHTLALIKNRVAEHGDEVLKALYKTAIEQIS
jgi:(p)ppGpp synthase/HD superfamily hydrolase